MRRLLALLFVVICLVTVTRDVFAQGAGVTLKPATIEETIDPGATKTYTVLVRNESDADQLYYLSKRDIVGVRDGGVPIYADPNIEVNELDMSQWITLTADTVMVPVGSEVPIQFTVNVPGNASPGSHFAGIFISVEPP